MINKNQKVILILMFYGEIFTLILWYDLTGICAFHSQGTDLSLITDWFCLLLFPPLIPKYWPLLFPSDVDKSPMCKAHWLLQD